MRINYDNYASWDVSEGWIGRMDGSDVNSVVTRIGPLTRETVAMTIQTDICSEAIV